MSGDGMTAEEMFEEIIDRLEREIERRKAAEDKADRRSLGYDAAIRERDAARATVERLTRDNEALTFNLLSAQQELSALRDKIAVPDVLNHGGTLMRNAESPNKAPV